MRRRNVFGLLCTGSLFCLSGAHAQTSARMRRIGFLSPHPAEVSQTSTLAAVFLSELQRAGYQVGRNLQLDALYAEGELSRLPFLAAELVRREAEVILASGNDAIAAAREATRKIPIVMAFAAEPVGSGLVDSLARPGGNVTGTTWLSAEIAAKALELLHEVVPGMRHLALLGGPETASMSFYRRAFLAAAAKLGVSPIGFPVYRPQEVDAALPVIAQSRAQALYVITDPATEARMPEIAAFALRNKMPTIGLGPRLVEAGGLLYYGADINETIARVVAFLDRILRGANPGDLPIEQPSRFELVVNARTARALGIALSGNVLMRATRVID